MVQNDFLAPLYTLPPLLVTLIVWVWGFGSLLLAGWKTKSIKTVVLKSPGMMIGDFLIIPAIAFLILLAYPLVDKPLPEVVSPWWNWAVLSLAFALTIISLTRHKNWYLGFMPHAAFYFFFAYFALNFLSKGLYQILFGNSGVSFRLLWVTAFFGITAHQLLGIIWRKELPKP